MFVERPRCNCQPGTHRGGTEAPVAPTCHSHPSPLHLRFSKNRAGMSWVWGRVWLLRGLGITCLSGHGEGRSDGITREQQQGWGRHSGIFLFLFSLHWCQATAGRLTSATAVLEMSLLVRPGSGAVMQQPSLHDPVRKLPASSRERVLWEPVLLPLQKARFPAGMDAALAARALSVAPGSSAAPWAVSSPPGNAGCAGRSTGKGWPSRGGGAASACALAGTCPSEEAAACADNAECTSLFLVAPLCLVSSLAAS